MLARGGAVPVINLVHRDGSRSSLTGKTASCLVDRLKSRLSRLFVEVNSRVDLNKQWLGCESDSHNCNIVLLVKCTEKDTCLRCLQKKLKLFCRLPKTSRSSRRKSGPMKGWSREIKEGCQQERWQPQLRQHYRKLSSKTWLSPDATSRISSWWMPRTSPATCKR